jgi:hypothetical protein
MLKSAIVAVAFGATIGFAWAQDTVIHERQVGPDRVVEEHQPHTTVIEHRDQSPSDCQTTVEKKKGIIGSKTTKTTNCD